MAELVVGLKDDIKAELIAAKEWSGKIHRLNQSLLWFTTVLGLLTAVQFGAWLRGVTAMSPAMDTGKSTGYRILVGLLCLLAVAGSASAERVWVL